MTMKSDLRALAAVDVCVVS